MLNLKKVLHTYVYSGLRFLPGNLGSILRVNLYRSIGIKIGKGTHIEVGAKLDSSKVVIGKNVHIGEFSYISAGVVIEDRVNINSNVQIVTSPGGSVTVGKDSLIGQNVVIRANDHNFSNLEIPINKQGHLGGEIIIGKNVWLAANVVVTRNTSIGDGSVIGAASVVTEDIPTNCVAVGAPARRVKLRSSNNL